MQATTTTTVPAPASGGVWQDIVRAIKTFFEFVFQLDTGNQFVLLSVLLVGYPVYKLLTDPVLRTDILSLFKRKAPAYSLKSHPIFQYRAIANAYINRIDLSSKLKNKAFTIILRRKTEVVLEALVKVVDEFEASADNKAISSKLLEVLDNIIFRYEQGIKVLFREEFGPSYEALYDYIYVEHFAKRHSANVAFILKGVAAFDQSSLTEVNKVAVFLNLVHTALDLAILDCELAFKSINGHLKPYELEYDNKQTHRLPS